MCFLVDVNFGTDCDGRTDAARGFSSLPYHSWSLGFKQLDAEVVEGLWRWGWVLWILPWVPQGGNFV